MRQDVATVSIEAWKTKIMTKRILILFLLPQLLWGQEEIPIGTWRTHFSFRDAHSIALTQSGAYCAGSNSLFFLDLEDNSLTKLSKIDGLSGTSIRTINFHESLNTLVIAYNDGVIDLLRDGEIKEINDIAETPISGGKSIHQIFFSGTTGYLSTDFGVVVLDLIKEEIREAYTNIGTDGSSIQINYGTVFQDSLFLATEEGVIAGALNDDVNLLDFTNWKRFGPSKGIPAQSVSTIATFDNRVVATLDEDGVYFYNNSAWDRLDFDLNEKALAVYQSQDALLLTLTSQLLEIDTNDDISFSSDPLYDKPKMALRDDRGLWVADGINGLVTSASGTLSSIYPSGPFSDSLSSLTRVNNSLIALPPGYDPFGSPLRTRLGANQFTKGVWTSLNATNLLNTSPFPDITDLVDVTFNSIDNKYYFASYGEGILQWNSDGVSEILDENSAGSTLINTSSGRNVKITSVLSAADGTIWATNHGNPQPLHQYNPLEESWKALATPFVSARFPLDLQAMDNGDFWMRLDPSAGGGIFVINGETAEQKLLTNSIGQGGLPSRIVNDLVIDRQGQVWAGTNSGIALYPFPFDILERPEVNASTVFIDGRPLLRDEKINSIAVDGGNRKWIGTDNGLWLFSELGDRVILNFTAQNSPLPSNVIEDVAIDETSGEVFIITDQGMVSYRGTATNGKTAHQKVRIFPNPITRDFSGTVGISGLVSNAIVKIVDITGQLVTELRAQGGTATWNVADFQGRKVNSGVYLIYSSNEEGNETFVGKVAVIN